MKIFIIPLLLISMASCRCYTYFSPDASCIYSTHKKGPQPYCTKVYVCTNKERDWHDWVYCIISPCCTGTYLDTTGLHAREVEYKKHHQ